MAGSEFALNNNYFIFQFVRLSNEFSFTDKHLNAFHRGFCFQCYYLFSFSVVFIVRKYPLIERGKKNNHSGMQHLHLV